MARLVPALFSAIALFSQLAPALRDTPCRNNIGPQNSLDCVVPNERLVVPQGVMRNAFEAAFNSAGRRSIGGDRDCLPPSTRRGIPVTRPYSYVRLTRFTAPNSTRLIDVTGYFSPASNRDRDRSIRLCTIRSQDQAVQTCRC